MDIFHGMIVLLVAGAAVALWLVCRKPRTVAYGHETYWCRKNGGFVDRAGRPVTDPALERKLVVEHDKRMRTRTACLGGDE